MNLPKVVQAFLERKNLPYRLISHPADQTLEQAARQLKIPLHQIARAILLEDTTGLVMVVLPHNHILDFSRLYQILQRNLEPLYGNKSIRFYQDHGCVAGCQPPLAELFGLKGLTAIDLSTDEIEEIFFDGGGGEVLVGMQRHDFRQLLAETDWEQFSIAADELDDQMSQQPITPQHLIDFAQRYTPVQPHNRIETITDLLILPHTAQKILTLRARLDLITTDDIIDLIEQHPNLAAQVVYSARSPLHGYHGPIDSLKTVVENILGFENTLNLLLSSSISQTFKVPNDGPIGLQSFWQHSVYCAALSSELSKLLPDNANVKPELAYLCGLLHNFGYLVLGHVLPSRFFLLNRFLAVNHGTPRNIAERHILGVEHEHIGAWLMQAWSMPAEVVAAVRWHHSEDCTQPHAEYPNLVLIANRLLDQSGLGEEENSRLPALAMFTLGITREQALETLERVQASIHELDHLSVALHPPAS